MICHTCLTNKPITEFNSNGRGSIRYSCKTCTRKADAKYRKLKRASKTAISPPAKKPESAGDKYHITIVLDSSGSMQSTRDSVISGFNEFILEQKKLNRDVTVSLLVFNSCNHINWSFERKPIDAVPKLTKTSYIPEGYTALRDAIHTATSFVKVQCCPSDKQIMLILTDGLENDSRYATPDMVLKDIADFRAAGHQLLFLGSNQDAVLEGSRLGIPSSFAMTYANNNVGTQSAFRSVTTKTSDYICSAGLVQSFNSSDRAEQTKAGLVQQ